MQIHKMVLLLVCISILSAGCASYKPQMQSMNEFDKYEYKQDAGGATVGLDPYYSPAKTRGVFDNDFKDHELLALNVMVFCPNGKKYHLMKSDIIVSDNNGKEFKPVGYKTAGDMVGRGYGYTVLWFFVGGIVGLIPSAIHTASVNTDIDNDLKAIELLEDNTISSATHGFVYYDMEPYGEKGAPTIMSAKLKLVDLETNEAIDYTIEFNPYRL